MNCLSSQIEVAPLAAMARYRGSPLAMCVIVVSDHGATNENNIKQIDTKTQ
jgi:uridine phosphorylase